MSVLHAESVGNLSQWDKTEFFIEFACTGVGGNHSVELQDGKAEVLALYQAVFDEGFADALSTPRGQNRITRVADMATAANIVRVEDI